MKQRIPKLDVRSYADVNRNIGSSASTPIGDFPTLDLNISIGLSSFAELDIKKAQVLAAAVGEEPVHVVTTFTGFGIRPKLGKCKVVL